jgi:biopolymer transport protein TolQ
VELAKFEQRLPLLATAGSVCPFLGLFGTVWGVMTAFLDISTRGSTSIVVVAPGIAEALITTIAGLAVAIPAVVSYNYFVQRSRRLGLDLEDLSTTVLNILQLRGRSS